MESTPYARDKQSGIYGQAWTNPPHVAQSTCLVVHQEEITRLRDEAVAIQMNQPIEDSEKREQEALKLKKEQEDKMTEMMAKSMQMSEFIQEEFLIQETAHQEEINVLREKTMQAENKAKKVLRHVDNLNLTMVEQQEQIKRTLKDAMDSELVCPICCEYFVQATSLNCSHTFCSACIETWLRQNRGCPQFRQIVTSRVRSLALDNHIDRLVDAASQEEKEARTQLKQERNNGGQRMTVGGTSLLSCGAVWLLGCLQALSVWLT
ncbi:hypothetical protein CAPTEDRAFT_208517 [Capitella teleta]|uniref:RING-type domain-containing protein n=1 Tax=Capitella teleta TaxID=283909 RepID=R7V070_CAPTE|nr:hypothetical protein CAPTEDRAFT_208517 [Capitella teleta]|eukprot:ELU12223.1 hypothetical protein CAPTEDRAFT_208517 [Capitella teleta]